MIPPGTTLFIAPDRNLPASGAGAFEKKILIVALEEPGHPSNREFLEKVIAAAGLDIKKDTLYAEIPASEPFNCLSGFSEKPQYILIFGLPASQAGLQFQPALYQPVAFHGSIWLFADSLSMLEPDRVKKSNLWNALKSLFLNN